MDVRLGPFVSLLVPPGIFSGLHLPGWHVSARIRFRFPPLLLRSVPGGSSGLGGEAVCRGEGLRGGGREAAPLTTGVVPGGAPRGRGDSQGGRRRGGMPPFQRRSGRKLRIGKMGADVKRSPPSLHSAAILPSGSSSYNGGERKSGSFIGRFDGGDVVEEHGGASAGFVLRTAARLLRTGGG